MISLTNISKSFKKPDEVKIFSQFNLELAPGEFTILVGSNGSGKSTLLNILAGTMKQDSGEVWLDGKEITRYEDYERSKWIARIYQDPLAGTAPELSILENFRLASLRTKRKGFTIGTNEKFKSLVTDKVRMLNLGLENKINQKVGSLSGGQRQSLSLLMAIADHTRLLLLDEPTAALDPRTSQRIMEVAENVIRQNKLTALMVTHQLRHVIDHGDRVVQLREGKIERDISGTAKSELGLQDVYTWFS